jgi:putative exosortase-associated protein (TIGR04073 family)
MKKVLVFLCVAMFLFSASVYANYADKAIEKGKQGLANVITGWLEVPYQSVKGFRDGFGSGGNKILGGFFGIFRGFVHAFGRTLTGVYEIVSFPLPNPKSNEGIGIPLDSQYTWEKGTQYSLVKEGLKPMGLKLGRGAVNLGLGWLDFPAQLSKGFSTGHPYKGMGKSLLYPLGRFASGLYEVVTCVLPGDAGSYGDALSEKNPWDAFSSDKRDNGL